MGEITTQQPIYAKNAKNSKNVISNEMFSSHQLGYQDSRLNDAS